jgi:hypothetical protein
LSVVFGLVLGFALVVLIILRLPLGAFVVVHRGLGLNPGPSDRLVVGVCRLVV